MKSNKQILIESVPGLITTAIILLLVLIFAPSFPVLALGLLGFVIIKGLWEKKTFKEIAPEALTLLIIIGSVKLLYDLFGGSGLWGLVVIVLFLAGVILWRARKQFLGTIRNIEKKHFGETAEERRERLRNEKGRSN